jgi:phosphoribosylglycinamide formyltransferase 1
MNQVSRKRVAVLISGRGSNMTALLAATKDPAYPADVVLVVSNRADAAGLAHATHAGVATIVIDHVGRDREAFDLALHDALAANKIEIVCLAGFMRLLTPSFVQRWHGRLLNIHPALLPAFKGLDTHARAIASGVKIHGATVHFVVAEMDSGPIIIQAAVPVFDSDTDETLSARVLAVEHKIYPYALKLVAEGLVEVVDGRCRIRGSIDADANLVVPATKS